MRSETGTGNWEHVLRLIDVLSDPDREALLRAVVARYGGAVTRAAHDAVNPELQLLANKVRRLEGQLECHQECIRELRASKPGPKSNENRKFPVADDERAGQVAIAEDEHHAIQPSELGISAHGNFLVVD